MWVRAVVKAWASSGWRRVDVHGGRTRRGASHTCKEEKKKKLQEEAAPAHLQAQPHGCVAALLQVAELIFKGVVESRDAAGAWQGGLLWLNKCRQPGQAGPDTSWHRSLDVSGKRDCAAWWRERLAAGGQQQSTNNAMLRPSSDCSCSTQVHNWCSNILLPTHLVFTPSVSVQPGCMAYARVRLPAASHRSLNRSAIAICRAPRGQQVYGWYEQNALVAGTWLPTRCSTYGETRAAGLAAGSRAGCRSAQCTASHGRISDTSSHAPHQGVHPGTCLADQHVQQIGMPSAAQSSVLAAAPAAACLVRTAACRQTSSSPWPPGLPAAFRRPAGTCS